MKAQSRTAKSRQSGSTGVTRKLARGVHQRRSHLSSASRCPGRCRPRSGADRPQPDEPRGARVGTGAEKLAADNWVRQVENAVAGRARAWTILRPSWFQQDFTHPRFYRDAIRRERTLTMPSGGARIAWVDARDIAIGNNGSRQYSLLRSQYRLHDKFRSVGARTWRKRGTASHRKDRGTYEKRVRDGRTESRGTWQHKDA